MTNEQIAARFNSMDIVLDSLIKRIDHLETKPEIKIQELQDATQVLEVNKAEKFELLSLEKRIADCEVFGVREVELKELEKRIEKLEARKEHSSSIEVDLYDIRNTLTELGTRTHDRFQLVDSIAKSYFQELEKQIKKLENRVEDLDQLDSVTSEPNRVFKDHVYYWGRLDETDKHEPWLHVQGEWNSIDDTTGRRTEEFYYLGGELNFHDP